MSKKAKIIISCVAAALVVLTVTLLCVFLIDRKPYDVDGAGSVSISKNDNGDTVLTATPDKWQSFAGWYTIDSETGKLSQTPASQDLEIVLEEGAPKYTAVFKATAIDNLDRALNGVYNKYDLGVEQEKDYFNFGGDINLNLTMGEDGTSMSLNIKAGGSFNFSGEGTELYLTVSSVTETSAMSLFGLYYDDNVTDAKLYTNMLGDMNTYDFISLTQLLSNIPNPSDHVWSIKNILYGAISDTETVNTVYSVIDNLLGLSNTQGLYNNSVNSADSSTLSLRLDVLLTSAQPILDLIGDSQITSILGDILNGLTSEYSDLNPLPAINLDISVGYREENDVEYIDNIDIGFSINENYNVNFGEVTTIEPIDLDLNINNIQLGFSETKNGIDESVLALFPEVKNLVNFHIDGELSFLNDSKDAVTATLSADDVTDVYDVDLYADLNVAALNPAISKDGFDYTLIDWEKLGFLSFTVTLDEDRSDVDAHKNADGDLIEDYINIFMDTEKYGPRLFVYAGLYNPELSAKVFGSPMYVTKEYFINTSFDISSLIDYLTRPEESTDEVSTQSTATENIPWFNIVVDVLSEVVSGEEIDMTSIVYNLLDSLLPALNDATVNELLGDISYNEQGIVIGTDAIRTKVDSLLDFSSLDPTLLMFVNLDGINLGNVILGENTTHIALKFQSTTFGDVEREVVAEGLGDYYVIEDEGVEVAERETLFDLYNEKHLTQVGAEDLKLDEILLSEQIFDKETYKEDLAEGTQFTAGVSYMSDGTESNTVTNAAGADDYEAKLVVLSMEVLEETDTSATIRFVLRRNQTDDIGTVAGLLGEKAPEILQGANGLESVIYNIGIPYGTFICEETIYFNSSTITANVNFGETSGHFEIRPSVVGDIGGTSLPTLTYQNGEFNQEVSAYQNVNLEFIPQTNKLNLTFSILNWDKVNDLKVVLNETSNTNCNFEISTYFNDNEAESIVYQFGEELIIPEQTFISEELGSEPNTLVISINISLQDSTITDNNNFSISLNLNEVAA